MTGRSVSLGSLGSIEEPAEPVLIDDEAVILGIDGRSDLNALHSGKHGGAAQLCAFDVLAIGGEDLRALSLCAKTHLSACYAAGPMGFREPLRDWRDRSGPLSSSLLHGPWRSWSRNAAIGLTAGVGRRLGEGQKPQSPGDRSREGGVCVTIWNAGRVTSCSRPTIQQTRQSRSISTPA